MNVAVKTAHIQRVCSLGSLTTTVGIIGRACRSLKLKKTRRLKAMIKAMINEELNIILSEHTKWLAGDEGKRANLRGADLSNADLSFADLRGADLDYSCLPLWCGSLKTHFDDKQLVQIAYHLIKVGLQSKNASEETKNQLAKLIDFANKFHRVGECGEITY